MQDIVVNLWGDLACFSPPYAKLERYSYPVPTPSALRGVMASIYSKPAEFYWLIRKIEVLNPIAYMPCMRNEVKPICGTKLQPIDVSLPKNRAQRMTVFLKDVRYRVTASIIPREAGPDIEAGLRKQAIRRIQQGQCFLQPSFGLRECTCYFELADMRDLAEPIHESGDFGLMVYDTHVPSDCTVGNGKMSLSLYHCVMDNGIIEVPDYDSDDVIKAGGDAIA